MSRASQPSGHYVRSIVAARAEHHSRVGHQQPTAVVDGKILDQLAHEGVVWSGHHHSKGEARGVSGGSHEIEASKRFKRALAREIEIQDST